VLPSNQTRPLKKGKKTNIMKNIHFVLVSLFIYFGMGTNSVQAPSVSSDDTIGRAVALFTAKIREREALLIASQKEIESRIDKLFEAHKKDQPLMMEHVGLLMDLYVAIKQAPIGSFPSLTALGFKHVPSYIQEFFNSTVMHFELMVKKMKKKKIVIEKRPLDDWEMEAYVTKLPLITSMFCDADSGYIHISSGYSAVRIHPIYHIVKPHLAQDLVDKCPIHDGKTPLFAPFAGMITKGENAGDGCFIILTDTASNFSITICHVRRLQWEFLNEGFVEVGDFIAFTGTTGDATGPHGHIETSKDGQRFNPSLVADWCTGEQNVSFLYQKGREVAQVVYTIETAEKEKIYCEILDNLTTWNATALTGTRR
jgi:murein DD-endopeptidase MepM/ murein hydrolase activator NlpD